MTVETYDPNEFLHLVLLLGGALGTVVVGGMVLAFQRIPTWCIGLPIVMVLVGIVLHLRSQLARSKRSGQAEH